MTSSLVLLTTQARALDDLLPCRRENPQLWFSDLPADLQLAKALCRPCPMRRACLAGAVERHEPHGVWGGEIFARGAIIPEKRPRGRPPSTLRPVIGVDARGIVSPLR
jgi:WhiB family transcriptional regulator, redox-sensing transcriptional regulator